MSQPLHIKGALLWDGDKHIERDLYIKKGRIVAENPNHAMTIDLAGCTLCPGLINAHDHLELNHYPRTKFREVYDNAHQWGEDVDKQLSGLGSIIHWWFEESTLWSDDGCASWPKIPSDVPQRLPCARVQKLWVGAFAAL